MWQKVFVGHAFPSGASEASVLTMRVFPLAWRTLAVALCLALIGSTAAHADDPTVGDLQVRLVESRMQLNGLYAQAAASAERLNGATYDLEQAEAAIARHHDEVEAARSQLDVERRAVADLTLAQLQSGTGVSQLTTLLESDGPAQLLERTAAYRSTQEAMAASLDALTASEVVHSSAVQQAESALASKKDAVARQKQARSDIETAIAAAEQMESDTRAERDTLLAQLAEATGDGLDAVTARQDEVDERLDRSGGVPPATSPAQGSATQEPAAPRPSASPTTPKPTTPKPTTPKPKLPVDPPPAAGSKVETAIAFARDQLGEPYQWGGAGPSSWDCSGLTMRAYQSAGINLPHYAGAQYAQTTKVPVSSIRRGDLLYWSNGGPGSIYHVALYLGDGQMIQAPRPGRGVEIVPLSYWIQPDLASRPA